MPEPGSLETAISRIEAAMSRLENAVSRRLDGDRTMVALEEELVRLGNDRSQLAHSLDQEAARAGRLEDANREVSRRLVAAMESIRSVLDAHGG